MDDDLIRLGLVDEDDIDLAEAALSLARLDHPDTSLTPHRALLDAMAQRLCLVGADAVSPEARADALASLPPD